MEAREVQHEERRHLEHPVAHARKTDPQTSKDAAAKVQCITELQMEILKALKYKGPMRDDELVYYIKSDPNGPKLAVSDSGIRSRRAEMSRGKQKLVEKLTMLGKPVKTEMASGNGGQVWKAV